MVAEQQITLPDHNAIKTDLQYMTARWDELPEPAVFEMRAFKEGARPQSAKFSPDWIEDAVDWAADMNELGFNIYSVRNPIRQDATGHAKDGDIIAAFFLWADCDDDDSAGNVKRFDGPKYSAAVVTGRKPGVRVHTYWQLAEPCFDMTLWREMQTSIAQHFGSDRAVVNPSRIMRVGGTVAYPAEKKRAKGYQKELTTIRTQYPDERPRVTMDQMHRVFGAAKPAGGAGGIEIDTGGENKADKLLHYLRQCGVDGEKHVGVRGVTSMLAARGNHPDVLEAVVRFACPVWDENVEKLIRSAYGFAPAAEDSDADGGGESVEPVDLWGRFQAPELPRGVLPQPIDDFAFIQGEMMGADPGGLAAAALCVACAAIPDRVQVKVKKHEQWAESARLWVALVGDPSTKKSPILSAAEKPLRKIDADMFRKFIAEKSAYDALKKEERANTERPKQRRKRLEDTTIEAAQEVMGDSPDGVLVLQDELSGWFGGMDRYNGGKGGKDRGFWLQAFNGGVYAVNRVGRGAGMIENLSACVLGGIQPEPIRKVVTDAADDGLIQRLFPIILRPAVLGSEDEPPADVLNAYATAIQNLSQASIAQVGSFIDTGEPKTLVFEQGAQEIRRQLEKKHLNLMSVECVNRKLAAHIGKYDGLFARLCVAFHCLEHHENATALPSVIEEATAKRATEFLHKFLLPHAISFYGGVLDLSDDHDRLTAVAGFILTKKLETLSVRDVQRGDNTMRKLTKPDILRVFEQLEALGWVRQLPTTRQNGSPMCAVNPLVHRFFAERRDAEAARRQQAQTSIKEAAKWS